MMKQMLKGDGMILFLFMFPNYMETRGDVLTNLVYCSNIGHTFALNTIVNC